MSDYLVRRIVNSDIEVLPETEVVGVDGDGKVQELTLSSNGVTSAVSAHRLFVMIGHRPDTGWLPEEIATDAGGFIVTGIKMEHELKDSFIAECGREPYDNETTMPGVFAIGDIRSESVKRVASAIGDGSNAVNQIWRYVNSPRLTCEQAV